VLRIIQRNRRNFATPRVWCAFGYTWVPRWKESFFRETLWQYPISYRLEKISADHGMWLTPITGRAVPRCNLKATQISVLPPKSEERVHKEYGTLNNTERAFSQASIAKCRLVWYLREIVDIKCTCSNEQSTSNEGEEKILKDKKLHL